MAGICGQLDSSMLLSVRSRPVDVSLYSYSWEWVLPSSRRALPDFFPTMVYTDGWLQMGLVAVNLGIVEVIAMRVLHFGCEADATMDHENQSES